MLSSLIKPGIYKHVCCRNSTYPKSNVKRFSVPDHLIFWETVFSEYSPPNYTAPHINGQVWADSEILDDKFQPQWNAVDGHINRQSHVQKYVIEDGYPINPFGRTGLRGRGLLGRWGPNHAADPIVTRWKRDGKGEIIRNAQTNKKVLQMVAIQRTDNKMWAIPGGMVDPGEQVSATLKREFMEEALDSFEHIQVIDDFFSNGKEVYKGYVDDFRNTDNSWIETVAFNFHDEDGDKIGKLHLSAGDDAVGVKWMDVNSTVSFHANHISFVLDVAHLLDADW